jgi:hypothetical protein
MDAFVINIGWEPFLGIMGGLIAAAYYINSRFTVLERKSARLEEMLTELLLNSENQQAKVFTNSLAVSLTTDGYHALARSGLRSYIDANRKQLISQFGDITRSESYELQRRAFRFFSELSFDDPVARHLNRFAFANGMSTILLRRVGAIYLRDIVVQSA